MLVQTSTKQAPWFVVPSDRNWYRNLVILQVLLTTIKALKPVQPPAEDDIAGLVVE